jgi:hypothetical protein
VLAVAASPGHIRQTQVGSDLIPFAAISMNESLSPSQQQQQQPYFIVCSEKAYGKIQD